MNLRYAFGFRCAACAVFPPLSSTLCPSCESALVAAPDGICAVCLGFHAESECPRAWARIDGEDERRRFDSFRAFYLNLGRSHEILKLWKRRPSRAIEARVFGALRAKLQDSVQEAIRESVGVDEAAAEPACVVPIPQSAARKLALRGGSADRFSRALASAQGTAVLDALEIDEVSEAGFRQGGAGDDDRYRRKKAFRVRGAARVRIRQARRLVLADDFATSGETLRNACAALRAENPRLEIHVRVLGLRPTFFPAEGEGSN